MADDKAKCPSCGTNMEYVINDDMVRCKSCTFFMPAKNWHKKRQEPR
jgi:DNA-directed RNA polymerase subunit RPC12/RpoP